MASLVESRQQLETAKSQLGLSKQQLAEEERKVSEYESQAQKINVPRRSLEFQQEFIASGKLPIGKVEQYVSGQRRIKRTALGQVQKAKGELGEFKSQLATAEQEISRYEGEIKSAEKEEADFEYGRTVAIEGGTYAPFRLEQGNQTMLRGYQYGLGQTKEAQSFAQIRQLQNLGLKPVFVSGQLTGFEDLTKQMSVPLDKFPQFVEKYRPQDIPKFEKAGLITTQKVSVPVSQVLSPISKKEVIESDISSLSVVEPASKLRERYYADWRKTYKEKPISGRLGLVFEQIGSKTSELLFQSKYSPFYKKASEAESIGKLTVFSAQAAVYGTPIVGTSLLIAQGGESLILGKGWKEKTKGAVFLTLGALGLRSEIKGIQQKAFIKKFEEAPLIVKGLRFEGSKSGADIILGYKRVGKTEFLVQMKQPYFLNERGFTLEGGEMTSFMLSKNKKELTASLSEVSGRVALVKNPKITKISLAESSQGSLFSRFTSISKKAKVQAGIGKAKIKEKVRGVFKLESGVPITNPNKIFLNAKGKFQKVKEDAETVNFISFGKSVKKNIIAVAGKPSLAKVKDDLSVSFLAKPSSVAKIRRVSLQDIRRSFGLEDISPIKQSFKPTTTSSGDSILQSTLEAPTKLEKKKKVIPTYDTTQIIDTAMRKLIPETKTTTQQFSRTAGTTINLFTSSLRKLSTRSSQESKSSSKSLTKVMLNQKSTLRELQEQRTNQKLQQQQRLQQSQLPKQLQRLKQLTKLKTINQFKSSFSMRPTPKKFPIVPALPFAFNRKSKKFKIKRRIFTSQFTKYTPSIGASLLNITDRKQPKELKSGGYLPTMRPVIVLKRRKANKKYGKVKI